MKYVVDTHGLIWFFTGSARLGQDARAVLSNPESELILPVTALAEACWLVERGKTPIPSAAALLAALDADPRISILPLDREVVERSTALTAIGEMHDRPIVATALLLLEQGDPVAIVTLDSNITESGAVHQHDGLHSPQPGLAGAPVRLERIERGG